MEINGIVKISMNARTKRTTVLLWRRARILKVLISALAQRVTKEVLKIALILTNAKVMADN